MQDVTQELFDALTRMCRMHDLMMKKVNHGASFYDAECLAEMNEAPTQARAVLNNYVQCKTHQACNLNTPAASDR